MFEGDMSRDVMEERREVHCLRAILSEQDFESVGGASGREGLRRTVPSSEKNPLPCKVGISGDIIPDVFSIEREESGGEEVVKTSSTVPLDVGGGIFQGVESSWAAMVSSMLASPQGASEQYMCRLMPSFKANGWKWDSVLSSSFRNLMYSEDFFCDSKRAWHSSNRKRLKDRIARTSACQS